MLSVVLLTSNRQAVLNVDATSTSSCRWTPPAGEQNLAWLWWTIIHDWKAIGELSRNGDLKQSELYIIQQKKPMCKCDVLNKSCHVTLRKGQNYKHGFKKKLVKYLEFLRIYFYLSVYVYWCKCSLHVCKKRASTMGMLCNSSPDPMPTALKAGTEVSQGQGLLGYRDSSTAQWITFGNSASKQQDKGPGKAWE